MTHEQAFIFQGQGSQEVGMAAKLLSESPIAREVFDRAEQVLLAQGWKRSLRDLCLHGPREALDDTTVAQPAITATGIATFMSLPEHERLSSAVTGHSVGEYSALVAAGAVNIENAMMAVNERGRLMKKAGESRPGAMVAIIGIPIEDVEILCQRLQTQEQGSIVQVANINTPSQTVISGDERALLYAQEFAQELGARVIPLKVSIAAHSPLMAPIVPEMKRVLSAIAIEEPKLPFYSPTTSLREQAPNNIRALLAAQLTGRVLWVKTVQHMIAAGTHTFCELGPRNILGRTIRQIDDTAEVKLLTL